MAAAAIFGLSFLPRVVDPRFDNDHYRMMAEGRQVLLAGEAPFRDFADPGIFLQIYTSAALQWLVGYNLLGQTLYGMALLSTAMALTFLLASRVSGSPGLAFSVTLLAVALDPRLKQHQVVLMPVVGLFVCWRYVEGPSTNRLVALAIVTALAFLIRHDLGVYVAATAVMAQLAAHRGGGIGPLLRRAGRFAAIVTASLTPFLAFLQANGGVTAYFRSAAEYVRAETVRQGVFPWPEFALDLQAPPIAVEALSTTRDAPDPSTPHVKVRWAEEVGPAERAVLEVRYRLAEPVRHDDPEGRTWSYVALDTSESNLGALVRDPLVEDTDGIDRATSRLEESDEDFLAALWRSMPLLQLRPLPGVLRPSNAAPWLYYTFLGLPLLACARLARLLVRDGRLPAEAPLVLSTALLALLLDSALRDPLEDRLADVAAPHAILGTWLLGQVGWGGSRLDRLVSRQHVAIRVVGRGVPLLLAGLTGWSVVAIVAEHRQVEDFALLADPLAVAKRFDDLRASPPTEAPLGVSGYHVQIASYVRECTGPTERLLVTWFAPELYFYANRAFAGRQLFWYGGYYSSPEDQARIVESLRAHSVPIVVERSDRDEDLASFDQVRAYIDAHYVLAQTLETPEQALYILVDPRRVPTGEYEPLSLPCFA